MIKKLADAEYNTSAALLRNVKERFGGNKSIGKCDPGRTPVDFR